MFRKLAGRIQLNTYGLFARLAVGLACCICLLAPWSGCKSAKPTELYTHYVGTYPIKATVTVGMVADIVRAIGGKHVEVTQLVGAGIDPHLHKPSRDDVLAIRSADIVLYNGFMLEGKMGDLLGRTATSRRTHAAAEYLPAAELDESHSEGMHGEPDPHVWMNVALWRLVAKGISAELVAYDPTHADDYHAAHQRLDQELEALHQYGIRVMQGVPPEQRLLVTSHDAFRYFGRAYGIEVQAIQGMSTESEAGLSRINELVDLLVTRKVNSVFVESSVPEDSVQALLRGAESRGHTVQIAGKLYSDAMGNAGTYEGTYIGMMDHNLSTIARALGCTEVPEGGFRESRQP